MAFGQALPDYHCLLLRHCLVQRCFRIRCCFISRLASLFYLNPTKTKNAIEFPCAEQFNILRGLLESYMTSFTFSTQVSGFNIMRIQPWHLERPLPVQLWTRCQLRAVTSQTLFVEGLRPEGCHKFSSSLDLHFKMNPITAVSLVIIKLSISSVGGNVLHSNASWQPSR